MKWKYELWELMNGNRSFFLLSVSECDQFDLEDLKACIDEGPEGYRQDFSETLYVAKKTKMCLHLFDLVNSIDGDLGDDFKVTSDARKILLRLIKEHGRIKVMRKIISGIRKIEEEMIGECRDICRTPHITEKEAGDKIKEKCGSPFSPRIIFGKEVEGFGRMFSGVLQSPTGRTLSF